MTDHAGRVGRRRFLLGAGAIALAACSREGSSAPGSGVVPAATASSTTVSRGPAPPALAPARFEGLAVCALLPGSAAGPFPTIDQLERRDVTEGYPGHPLRLGLRVVDPACRPVPGADVEIWHADVSGDYSSYADNGTGKDEGEGTTFLRGFQRSDPDGIVEFQTIYPGWYAGRAVHVHTRVRLDGAELLTAQLYFDEDYTAGVYTADPYAEFGPPDTSWATDRIVGDPATDGTGITLSAGPTWNGDGTLGLLNMGVPA